MNDEQWAKIEARRERNRYFQSLVNAADEASRRPVKRPKKRRKAKAAAPKPPKGPRVPKPPREPKPPKEPGVMGRPSRMPERCEKCDRLLRSAKKRASEVPGTVPYHGHNMCRTCAKGGAPVERLKDTSCETCEIPLRHGKTLLTDAPGTKKAARKVGEHAWICSDCARRERDGSTPRPKIPENCVQCGVGMVPYGRKDVPEGMKHHRSRGLCKTCYAIDYYYKAKA